MGFAVPRNKSRPFVPNWRRRLHLQRTCCHVDRTQLVCDSGSRPSEILYCVGVCIKIQHHVPRNMLLR